MKQAGEWVLILAMCLLIGGCVVCGGRCYFAVSSQEAARGVVE